MLPFPIGEVVFGFMVGFGMAVGEAVDADPFAIAILGGIAAQDDDAAGDGVGQVGRRAVEQELKPVGAARHGLGRAHIGQRLAEVRGIVAVVIIGVEDQPQGVEPGIRQPGFSDKLLEKHPHEQRRDDTDEGDDEQQLDDGEGG